MSLWVQLPQSWSVLPAVPVHLILVVTGFGWFNSKRFASDRWSTPSSEWVIYTQRSEHMSTVSSFWWFEEINYPESKAQTQGVTSVELIEESREPLPWPEIVILLAYSGMVQDVWDIVRWFSNMLGRRGEVCPKRSAFLMSSTMFIMNVFRCLHGIVCKNMRFVVVATTFSRLYIVLF